MAEFNVDVRVSGPPAGDVSEVVETVTGRAAELALQDFKAFWPVKTGKSRAGLHVEGSAVLGFADYTNDVSLRGSRAPISEAEAPRVGARALRAAIDEAEDDVTGALDGLLANYLSSLEG